jgi:hypothetical protein
MPNMGWGDVSRERAEKLLAVFVNHEQYPDKIKAFWQEGVAGGEHLSVIDTTKKALAELVNGGQPIYESQKLASAKQHIQTSLEQLAVLGFLEDRREVKKGPVAQTLILLLKLPSREEQEVINAFMKKWPVQTRSTRETLVFSNRDASDQEIIIDLQIPNDIPSITIKIGHDSLQVDQNASLEKVKVLVGTYLQIQINNPAKRSAFDEILTKSLTGSAIADTEQEELQELVTLLNSDEELFQFLAAVELAELESKDNAIEVLENTIRNFPQDSLTPFQKALSWQLALSLGALDPDHPKAATAQSRSIDLDGEWELELLVAGRIREDGDIDILLQLYSPLDPELPPGLTLEVLDELGESIVIDEQTHALLRIAAQEEDPELTLDFYTAPADEFQVKIIYGDASFIGNFVA